MGLDEELLDSVKSEELFEDRFSQLADEHKAYENILKIIPIFGDKRSAERNLEILEILAYWGKLAKYDLTKKVLSAEKLVKVEKLDMDGRYLYPTIKRRVDNLHSRGYLKVFGTRTARKRGDEINLYGLSHKGRLVAGLSSRFVSVNWHRMMEHYLEDEVPRLQELFKIFLDHKANIMSWMATPDYVCILNSPYLDYYKGGNEVDLTKRRMECIAESLADVYREAGEKGLYPEHLAYVRDHKLNKEEATRVIEAFEDPRTRRLASLILRTKIENLEREIEAQRARLKLIEPGGDRKNGDGKKERDQPSVASTNQGV